MNSWNELYTIRKQKEMTKKEMTKKAISKQQELKPLYKEYNYYNTDSYQARKKEQLKKDRFAWKVGIAIMTIISMVGFYAIYWAATL